VRHRTADEIARATTSNDDALRDPQLDDARVQRPELLVVIGVCTHLGCVPLGQKTGEVRGDYDGWFCPCHGSHYDTSGRIRKGPAPTNLEVPPYTFLSDSVIRIG
jgi:ubiquinol-cytochrome c reductase iron-sulfur subunit